MTTDDEFNLKGIGDYGYEALDIEKSCWQLHRTRSGQERAPKKVLIVCPLDVLYRR